LNYLEKIKAKSNRYYKVACWKLFYSGHRISLNWLVCVCHSGLLALFLKGYEKYDWIWKW